jgi:hypothetical protein
MQTLITFIYGLYEINNPNTIRYIGKTNNPSTRLRDHLSEAKRSKYNNHRLCWIRSTITNNEPIGLKVLKVCPLSDFVFYETEFIKLYKSDKLTNSDDSGQGNINRKREIIENAAEKISKKVYQFDLNGIFINEYKSARFASRELNIDHSHIIRCCNGVIKHTNKFIFKYKNEKPEPILLPNAVKKSIMEIDINGNIINKWKSLMDCSRDTKIDNGNLSRVCNGKLPHIRKRIFKFEYIIYN